MTSTVGTYDIILLYIHCREHYYYLNLVKFLAPEYSIGILLITDPKPAWRRVKTTESNQMLMDMCQDMGAHILDINKRYDCKLLLAPQADYNEDFTVKVTSKVAVVLHRFGSGSQGLETFKKMGINKIWVYENKLFFDVAASEQKADLANQFDVSEMGSPYARYPAFDFSPLNIDYLIAYPTLMLIREPQKKIQLLESINLLIDRIPNDKVVCLKPHNTEDGGAIIGRNSMLKKLGGLTVKSLDQTSSVFFSTVSMLNLGEYVPDRIYNKRIDILETLLENKVVFLSDLSEYYNFGIEHFLPFVKEGVITGISSCIWHCLYNQLPVYNCDNQPFGEHIINYAVYEHFYIPFCQEQLDFNPAYYNKVSETAKQADLITMIKNELNG